MNPLHTPRAVAATMLMVSCALPATGAIAVISPVADASIFQNNVNNGSGGGNGLFVGANASGSVRRALVAFDVAGEIPPGAVIENATLVATLGDYSRSNPPPSVEVSLHRLTSSWGEGTTHQQIPPSDVLAMMGQGMPASAGDVTWDSRFHASTLATPWATPGGDSDPLPTATATVGTTIGENVSWTSPAMASDVQSWLDSPAANFGWLLQNGSESTASSLRVFYSSDVATPGNWPRLEVTFRPPGDFNGDDAVNGDDLAVWKSQFRTQTPQDADADRDGDVDGADFLLWQRHVGPSVAAIPEPGTLPMLLIAAMIGLSTHPESRRR